MAIEYSVGAKPQGARYRAKAEIFPDGVVKVTPDGQYPNFPHELDLVVIGWYDDRVKITFPHGGPACITQAYLTGDGKDVIIEVRPAAPVS